MINAKPLECPKSSHIGPIYTLNSSIMGRVSKENFKPYPEAVGFKREEEEGEDEGGKEDKYLESFTRQHSYFSKVTL